MNLKIDNIDLGALRGLLRHFSLEVVLLPEQAAIPGSYWGAPEAGLIGNTLYVRADTPVHSLMHEACHYICMDDERRSSLHTDAGGGTLEENGVCYLQILLSDAIKEMGRERMFSDMDEWGYSFRLGSAKAWFEQDADDAVEWLLGHHLINEQCQLSWCLRS